MKKIVIPALIAAAVTAAVFGTASTTEAASTQRCLRIALDGGSEVLVNSCDQCRIATIIRSRPGSDVPVGRKYNVQPKSTFPVPFRGPGRSRIASDFPCPGEEGGDKDLLNLKKTDAKSDEKCVAMEHGPNNSILLVNSCGTCRAVAIERLAEGATSGARDYFLLTGSSRLPVSANGYVSVGLLGDIPCPG